MVKAYLKEPPVDIYKKAFAKTDQFQHTARNTIRFLFTNNDRLIFRLLAGMVFNIRATNMYTQQEYHYKKVRLLSKAHTDILYFEIPARQWKLRDNLDLSIPHICVFKYIGTIKNSDADVNPDNHIYKDESSEDQYGIGDIDEIETEENYKPAPEEKPVWAENTS